MDRRLKQVGVILGFLSALPGALFAVGFLCAGLLALISPYSADTFAGGMTAFMLAVLLLGGGAIVFGHSYQSLTGRPSSPLRLRPAWALAGIFGLFIAIGSLAANEAVSAVLFPPTLALAAAMPPLAAISWFANQHPGGLTWRRGLVAFVGGGTVSVIIALAIEIILPLIVLALVFNLVDPVLPRLETLFGALAGKNVAQAITNPAFIYLFIQVAVIAPLAEEFAKPLITLPILDRLTRRDAFLVGALAGAGFAALENVLYAGFGFAFWAGILLVRALGAAVHPLGSGLTALAWRDVLLRQPNAGVNWLFRFGAAVGLHALWNGGSLLVITLAGARFFGNLPPELDVLGLSAAGTTLALLIILGLVALWLGRSVIKADEAESSGAAESASFIISNRAAAIWGLTCLAAIVPAGIAGLQLLVR